MEDEFWERCQIENKRIVLLYNIIPRAKVTRAIIVRYRDDRSYLTNNYSLSLASFGAVAFS